MSRGALKSRGYKDTCRFQRPFKSTQTELLSILALNFVGELDLNLL